MLTPDRLSLTLQRIEEFLVTLQSYDFDYDVEGGRRVVDDLNFLHRELRAGRKTLPFPRNERRPLDIALGYDAHFGHPFDEAYDRACDLIFFFKAARWPLLSWQASPIQFPIDDEQGLRALYARLREALIERRLDQLIAILEPGLKAASLAVWQNEEFELVGKRNYVGKLMAHPDYRSVSPPPEVPVIRPMFDGCRVRLHPPGELRHALGVSPYNGPQTIYPIQCQFGRIDGHWMVVSYG